MHPVNGGGSFSQDRSSKHEQIFVSDYKRSEAALIQVIQEAYIQGVSTRKMEKVAESLGTQSLSRSQVSEITKGLNEQAGSFRNRPLEGNYPVIWVDALYEKVRLDGRVITIAIQVVCGVWKNPKRATGACFKACVNAVSVRQS